MGFYSHSRFLFIMLCMFTLVFTKTDGMNAEFFNQTGIKAVNRQGNPRVLGGINAPASTFQTLAKIIIVGKRAGSVDRTKLCTATVLNRRWLLTAAHCLFFREGFRASITDSYAFVGESDATLTPDTTTIRPYRFAKYLTHRKYVPNSSELGNDLALIFLNRPIARNIFRNVRLSARRSNDPRPVATVQVAGYGFIDNPSPNKFRADRVMQASVTLQTFAKCNAEIPARISNVLDEREFVCSVPRPNGRGENADICFGDSGGPIFRVINNRIVQFGIISFASTIACATPSTVNYYTRVSNFHRDIRQGRRMNFASWRVVNA